MSAQQQGSLNVKSHWSIDDPEMYDVILLNDDFTPMDFVVMILTNIFFLSEEVAEDVMLSVHNQGQGVAGTYTYDIAHSKASKATAMARKEGFPLRLKIQKHT